MERANPKPTLADPFTAFSKACNTVIIIIYLLGHLLHRQDHENNSSAKAKHNNTRVLLTLNLLIAEWLAILWM